MVDAKDKIIADAVAHKIRSWNTLDELRDRCTIYITPESVERLVIDGELMVEFYPPQYTQPHTVVDGSHTFHANTEYRYKLFYEKDE